MSKTAGMMSSTVSDHTINTRSSRCGRHGGVRCLLERCGNKKTNDKCGLLLLFGGTQVNHGFEHLDFLLCVYGERHIVGATARDKVNTMRKAAEWGQEERKSKAVPTHSEANAA